MTTKTKKTTATPARSDGLKVGARVVITSAPIYARWDRDGQTGPSAVRGEAGYVAKLDGNNAYIVRRKGEVKGFKRYGKRGPDYISMPPDCVRLAPVDRKGRPSERLRLAADRLKRMAAELTLPGRNADGSLKTGWTGPNGARPMLRHGDMVRITRPGADNATWDGIRPVEINDVGWVLVAQDRTGRCQSVVLVRDRVALARLSGRMGTCAEGAAACMARRIDYHRIAADDVELVVSPKVRIEEHLPRRMAGIPPRLEWTANTKMEARNAEGRVLGFMSKECRELLNRQAAAAPDTVLVCVRGSGSEVEWTAVSSEAYVPLHPSRAYCLKPGFDPMEVPRIKLGVFWDRASGMLCVQHPVRGRLAATSLLAGTYPCSKPAQMVDYYVGGAKTLEQYVPLAIEMDAT